MTPNAIVNQIQTHFKTLIADVRELETAYDNVIPELTTYADPQVNFTEVERWAEVHVLLGTRFVAEFGNPKNYRTPGVLFVNLFEKMGEGTETIGAHMDAIVAAFQGVTRDGIVYEVPNPTRLGRQGSKFQISVQCPFRHDDLQ